MNEIATKSKFAISIEEEQIPAPAEVRGVCEMLGLDPLYVANEGRCVVFVPQKYVQRTLEVMHRHEEGVCACLIGNVQSATQGKVFLKGSTGVTRILDLLSGEQMPRIC